MIQIEVAPSGSPGWQEAAAFVRAGYAGTYGAVVDPRPDFFVVATDSTAAHAVVACGGLTFGGSRPFFSENYLDLPVTEAIQMTTGEQVNRADIVEAGSFMATGGHGAHLMRMLPLIGWCSGMRFALCTATSALADTLPQLNVPFIPLAKAVPRWMTAGQRRDWGTYYDHDPVTGIVPLGELGALLRSNTGRYRFVDPRIVTRPGGRPDAH